MQPAATDSATRWEGIEFLSGITEWATTGQDVQSTAPENRLYRAETSLGRAVLAAGATGVQRDRGTAMDSPGTKRGIRS